MNIIYQNKTNILSFGLLFRFLLLLCCFALLFLIIILELIIIHLSMAWYTQNPDDVLLDGVNDLLIASTLVPDRYGILIVSNRYHNAIYFIWVGKLFTNHAKDQVLPELIRYKRLYLVEPYLPTATICILFVLPGWLYSFHKL